MASPFNSKKSFDLIYFLTLKILDDIDEFKPVSKISISLSPLKFFSINSFISFPL